MPRPGVCDVAENCTGSGPNCPADAFQPSSAVCRPAAGPCDQADNCPGTGVNCTADVKQPSGFVCRAQSDVCDVQEVCDGVSNACPADSVAGAFVVCRPDAGQCDVVDNCDGVNKACPPDAFEPNGLPCDDMNTCSPVDTCQNGQCIGTFDPDGCLDDFLCYKEKKAGEHVVFGGVSLADMYETGLFDVEVRKHLCTPADKNGEGLLDPDTHLRGYLIRPPSGGSSFVKHLGESFSNQLGPVTLDIVRRNELLVPTLKSLSGSPGQPDPGAPNYEHFKCYKARRPRTEPFFTPVNVTVADQFINPAISFTVVKPTRVCTPVDKNGEGIVNGSRHLVCYKVRPLATITVPAQVFVNNQFGPETVVLKKPDELCIPSVKLP